MPDLSTFQVALAVCTLASGFASAQEQWEVDTIAKQGSSYFGRYACLTIDIDGDGVRDVAAGARYGGTDRRGVVAFLSGKDLRSLKVVAGPEPKLGWFGSEVYGSCGDLDGDGAEDLIVKEHHGGVVAYSPKTSQMIMRFPRGMDYAGPVGDLDGDGCDDVALSSGSWLIDQGFQHNDYIASGRTGERLITIDTTRDSFVAYRGDILGPIENGLVETVGPYTLTLRKARPAGLSFVQVHLVEVGMNIGNVSVGDFDGDRHLDVINPRCDLWSGRKASVRLYSSRTQLMREIPNPSPDVSLPTPVGGSEPVSAFAYAATLIPDMNGDGLVEFAISDPEVFRRGVGWYENSRLQRYWSWESFQGFACSGVNLELIPDRDGDGLADLLIVSGDWQMVDWVPEIDGNLAIVSTRTGATVASIEEVAINPTLGVPVSVR